MQKCDKGMPKPLMVPLTVCGCYFLFDVIRILDRTHPPSPNWLTGRGLGKDTDEKKRSKSRDYKFHSAVLVDKKVKQNHGKLMLLKANRRKF
ncbi:hypothetical protein CEXT_115591 [Caerostris extrusa]|uniref:Uncharacterized protein n=1 Tax=Caerostris extrusa TaxID=172846 RepID=A0AAV4RW89_CAEEX|nr:hypothetical protein CEXT_115591 [Caerostris extrusa]